MERSRLLYLIQRYSDNTATPSELEELSQFIEHSPDADQFTEVILEQMDHETVVDGYGEHGAPVDGYIDVYEGLVDRALLVSRNTSAEALPTVPKKRHITPWMWAAACVLLLVIGGIYISRLQTTDKPALAVVETSKPTPAIITPGRNGAILTLSDGTTVALDSLGNGKIASQKGADVFVRQGRLTYAATGQISGAAVGNTSRDAAGNASDEVAYNTLSTPKGRQYHIRLPDGTEAWLNAASSIHYPTQFSGGERVVDVTGEAYFEVAKDASRPFRVRLGRSQIDVLGTHFNVNAYSNEPVVATTLLEGSVRFSAGDGKSRLLRPGEQSRFDQATQALTLADSVKTSRVIAWKNGIFDFNDLGLRETMQQLERWYDIDVKYEKKIPNIRFFGKMTKNIQLADLLAILEKAKVHFQVEGRTLIVKP